MFARLWKHLGTVDQAADPVLIANSGGQWTGAHRLAGRAYVHAQPFDLALPNHDGVTPLGNCDLCFLKAEATIRGIVRYRPELAAWWIARETEARPSKPSGARFRLDRPGYREMTRDAERQGDLIEYLDHGGSLDCACTD